VNGTWVSLLTLVLVVAVLWAGKAILLPLALGIVLAFMLTPLVRLFDRARLPRFAGVALTMLLALGAVGGVGYVVFDQFVELSTEVTRYTSSMRRKVADLRIGNDVAFRQLTRTVDRVTEQLDDNAAELKRAQPVRVVAPRLTPAERLRDATETVFEPIISAVIVIALVAFMLGQREDLRDRFIRLLGADSVNVTTRLMDEAAHRVSQFLVWQTLINVVFGALVTAGLYWIGVPYAALWGGLTAVLRFVPYVGTLLSVAMPASLAFATFPGWTETLQTMGLFLTLDLMTAWFIEPFVFGHRTGVSSFALLISALFWIWVWGPVGLLLATPLTVCFAVLGRHVRSLRFLAVILADEPALAPHMRFYQRLLARDEDEASALVERKHAESGSVGVIDELLLPALLLLAHHRSQDEISEEDASFILDVMRELLLQLPPEEGVRLSGVIGLAARDPLDQTALEMLRAVLGGSEISLIAEGLMPEDAVLRAIEQQPKLVCVVAVSPSRGAEIRNYCRRIRSELPDAGLLVFRPHVVDADLERSAARMKDAGADRMVTNVKDAVEAVQAAMSASATPSAAPAAKPAPASYPFSATRRSSAT
jgi:predicted PurR-regulated permease PerM